MTITSQTIHGWKNASKGKKEDSLNQEHGDIPIPEKKNSVSQLARDKLLARKQVFSLEIQDSFQNRTLPQGILTNSLIIISKL